MKGYHLALATLAAIIFPAVAFVQTPPRRQPDPHGLGEDTAHQPKDLLWWAIVQQSCVLA